MSSIKLSIIVPVYNVAPYLRKCVDSLLMQDLNSTEYEIILVDDGSPDGCPAICDEYAQALHPSGGSRKGANIVVIHQPNAGLSAARNSGLKVAQGKYVQFVDSDDYLEPNVLGGLVAQMEREELDVLRFDYQNVRISATSTYEVFQPYKHPHQVDKRTDVVDGITYLNERMGYACYAVMFMIRRKMLKNCIFTLGIYGEDIEWTPRMLLEAKRVSSSSQIVYNYLVRKGSITNTISEKKKLKIVDDELFVIASLLNTSKSISRKCWFRGMIASITKAILNYVAVELYSYRDKYINELKGLHVFPIATTHSKGNAKMKLKLINLSPRFFVWFMHILSTCK